MPTQDDVTAVAQTLFGEARGCNMLDRLAVCAIIRERVLRPGWWTREQGDGIPDDTYAAACLDDWQFTCWRGEIARRKMLAAHKDTPLLYRGIVNLAEYTIYQMTDGDVRNLFDVDGPERHPTHYHDRSLSRYPEAWGEDVEEIMPRRQGSQFRFYVVKQGRPPRV